VGAGHGRWSGAASPGRARINWRLTPGRVLTRTGLAAEHARNARNARAAGDNRKRKQALAKLDRAMERAVEYGGSAPTPTARPLSWRSSVPS
jgi:hypothetical protein